MGAAYLLDSNVIIYLINGTLSPKNSKVILEAAKQPAHVSVISKIEILGWNPPTQKEADECQSFMDDAVVLDLSNAVVEKTIEIRKTVRSKLPDAIIGATALVHGLTLLTRNVSDFSNVPGVNVIDPFSSLRTP